MSHRYRVAFKETLCGKKKSFYNNGFVREQSSFRETTIHSSYDTVSGLSLNFLCCMLYFVVFLCLPFSGHRTTWSNWFFFCADNFLRQQLSFKVCLILFCLVQTQLGNVTLRYQIKWQFIMFCLPAMYIGEQKSSFQYLAYTARIKPVKTLFECFRFMYREFSELFTRLRSPAAEPTTYKFACQIVLHQQYCALKSCWL